MLQNDPLRRPPFHFDADPDPAFYFDADPCFPPFHFDADPDHEVFLTKKISTGTHRIIIY